VQWSDSVHPEGKIYFHRNSGLRVVTESYLYNPVTAESFFAWVIEVEERALKKGFTFTDHTELFLQLDGNDCNYYFVIMVSERSSGLTHMTLLNLEFCLLFLPRI